MQRRIHHYFARHEPLERVQRYVEGLMSDIRRLLQPILTLPARIWQQRMQWSCWRRVHQARAQRCHYRRRMVLADP